MSIIMCCTNYFLVGLAEELYYKILQKDLAIKKLLTLLICKLFKLSVERSFEIII